ncbi:MAG: hypothetical protein JNL81_13315 [Hyphomonadaceae bacterium]|nr:hypothetical protein [Hyphomonadaceae bacterium]
MTFVHTYLAPLLAFAAFIFGLYGVFFAVGRADWPVVLAAALIVVAGAMAAFVVRKARPNLTLALATAPAALLAAVILFR